MSDRETQDEAAREWAESVAGDEADLQDGLNESAGEVDQADGAIESDDLSGITFTASDDDPSTDELDIGTD